MKKLITWVLNLSSEVKWSICEMFVIFLIWHFTQNFLIVVGVKLLSTFCSEELFHEEIGFTIKRMMWHTLSFIGYVTSFALIHSGYWAQGYGLTGFVVSVGYILLNSGCFHQFTIEGE